MKTETRPIPTVGGIAHCPNWKGEGERYDCYACAEWGSALNQGLIPLAQYLTLAGEEPQIDQTGGFCMAIRFDVGTMREMLLNADGWSWYDVNDDGDAELDEDDDAHRDFDEGTPIDVIVDAVLAELATARRVYGAL